jgi:hypothetical protein
MKRRNEFDRVIKSRVQSESRVGEPAAGPFPGYLASLIDLPCDCFRVIAKEFLLTCHAMDLWSFLRRARMPGWVCGYKWNLMIPTANTGG